MIRLATLDDVPDLVEMGVHFLESSSYATQLARSPEKMEATARAMITGPDSDVFVIEHVGGLLTGMIIVCVYEHPLSGERVAGELCWWVEPSARGPLTAMRLLQHAERWAIEHDADVFQMMAPTEKVGRFYETLRYEKLETHYQRRLRHATVDASGAA